MKYENSITKRPFFLALLFLSAFLIFFGRSLELLLWEAPLRAFFWDEGWLKPIIENVLHYDWFSYTTNPKIDKGIEYLNDIFGLVLGMAAISILLLYKRINKKVLKSFVIAGSVIVGIILLLEFKEKFYHSAQFLEGFVQFFTPIALLLYVTKQIKIEQLYIFLKIIVALTFLGHGLYAIGYYATPGNFIDMIIVMLGVSEPIATNILLVVGVLDIFLILLIFIPATENMALYYAIIWGFLTALARFCYYFKLNGYALNSLDAIYATIFRLPHGLVPLTILLIKKYTHKVK